MITARLITLITDTLSINPQHNGPSALMLLNFNDNLRQLHTIVISAGVLYFRRGLKLPDGAGIAQSV